MTNRQDMHRAMAAAFEQQNDAASEVLDTIEAHFSREAAVLANIASSVALMHAQNLPAFSRLSEVASPRAREALHGLVDSQGDNATNIARALLSFGVHCVLNLDPIARPADEARANEYQRLFSEVTERRLTGLLNAVQVGEQRR